MSLPEPPAIGQSTPPVPRLRAQWLRGASWLSVGSVASLAVSAVAGVLLARFLSPGRFGTYAAVTVATSLVATLSTYGLDVHLVTVLRNDETDAESYCTVVRLAFVLGLAATAAGEIVAWLAFPPHERLPLMIDLGEVAFAPLLLRQVVLQVRGHQRSIVFAQMLNRTAWILVVVLVITTRPADALSWLMGGQVAVLCLQGAALAALARFPGRRLYRHHRGRGASPRHLRASAPIALSSIFGTAYNRLDQLILTAIRGSYATGLYAGAVRLAELPGAIPAIVQNVSLPTLIQVRQTGRAADMSRALNDALLLTIVPGGLAVALLAGLGKPLIVVVLGQRFAGAATVVVILAAADWARLPATVYTSLALAMGRRQVLVIATGCGLAINIVVNLALIPFLGAPAAAVASLLGYGTSAVLIARGALRGTGASRLSYSLPVRLAAAAVVASLVGRVGIVMHTAPLPLPAAAVLIVIAYALAVGALLPATERRRLVLATRPLRHRALRALGVG